MSMLNINKGLRLRSILPAVKYTIKLVSPFCQRIKLTSKITKQLLTVIHAELIYLSDRLLPYKLSRFSLRSPCITAPNLEKILVLDKKI